VEVDVDPLNSASRAADRCESDVWSWPRVKVAEEEDSARIADRVRGVGRVVVLLLTWGAGIGREAFFQAGEEG